MGALHTSLPTPFARAIPEVSSGREGSGWRLSSTRSRSGICRQTLWTTTGSSPGTVMTLAPHRPLLCTHQIHTFPQPRTSVSVCTCEHSLWIMSSPSLKINSISKHLSGETVHQRFTTSEPRDTWASVCRICLLVFRLTSEPVSAVRQSKGGIRSSVK